MLTDAPRPATEAAVRTGYFIDEHLQFIGAAAGNRPGSLPFPEPLPATGLDFARIAAMPLILPGRGHGLRDLLDGLAEQAGLELNAVIEVDSYSNIKMLVAESLGGSILPEHAITADVAEGRLRNRAITRPAISREIHLAHSVRRPMTNAVAAVLALAREILRDLVRSGHWIGAHLPDGAPA